jgi:hypothetical protein
MTRSQCHICGATFTVKKHEMRYFGNKDIKRAQYQNPVSYPDWQAHLMLTCPLHRLPRMPDSCYEDMDKFIALENKHQDSD